MAVTLDGRTCQDWCVDSINLSILARREDERQRAVAVAAARQEGWDAYHPGACFDPASGVSFPWHNTPVPAKEFPARCIRCGKREPQ